MIVKVQLPIVTSEQIPKALLYDRSRRFEMFHPITDHIREQMRGRPKAFFEVDLSQGEPLLVKEVPDPGW